MQLRRINCFRADSFGNRTRSCRVSYPSQPCKSGKFTPRRVRRVRAIAEAQGTITEVAEPIATENVGPVSDIVSQTTVETAAAATDSTAQLSEAASVTLDKNAELLKEVAAAAQAYNPTAKVVAKEASVSVDDVSKSLQDGISSVVSGASDATASVAKLFEQGFTQPLSGLASNANNTTAGVAKQLSSGLDQTASSLAGGAGTIQKALDAQLGSVRSELDAVSSQVYGGYSSAVQQVESVYGQVAAQIDSTVGAASRTLEQEYLPVALEATAFAKEYALVVAPFAAVGGAVALLAAYKSYEKRYSGFAGEIPPENVRELLASDAALLVDIRSLEERESAGVPQLKLAARFKAVVWNNTVSLLPKLAGSVSNPAELAKDINAAYIGGLRQVSSPLTKFIIMDSQGSDAAREVARALKRIGYGLPFIMQGGFRQWEASGLPIVQAAEYEAGALDILSDEIEVLNERTVKALEPLADPWVGVPVAVGGVFAVLAVSNFHLFFEYIGVASLLITVEKKLLSYSSPSELLEDVQGLAGSVTQFVGEKALPSIASTFDRAVSSVPAVELAAPTSINAAVRENVSKDLQAEEETDAVPSKEASSVDTALANVTKSEPAVVGSAEKVEAPASAEQDSQSKTS